MPEHPAMPVVTTGLCRLWRERVWPVQRAVQMLVPPELEVVLEQQLFHFYWKLTYSCLVVF